MIVSERSDDGRVRSTMKQFRITAYNHIPYDGGRSKYQLTDWETGMIYGNGTWYSEEKLRKVQ